MTTRAKMRRTATVPPPTRRRPAPILTGAELRAVRLRLGLTQAELARRLGYTRSAIWRWERQATAGAGDDADGGRSACVVIPLAQVARLLDALEREIAAQEAHRALCESLGLPSSVAHGQTTGGARGQSSSADTSAI